VVRAALNPYKRISMKWHEPRMSWLEGVFSRGGRELAPAVERAYRLGALFSSWVDHLDLVPWEQAFKESGIDTGQYFEPRDPDGPLPWDHLRCGASRAFLARERGRALEGKYTEDCRYGACMQCGACSVMCKTPEIAAADIRPRVNLPAPEWESSVGEEVPEVVLNAPPQAREELTRKAGHYRVWFSKTGPAAYLSQLELANVLERALRRSGLKPTFSGGFHPMPLVSFGWALPVGVESREEWFGLFLREATSLESVSARLGSSLPEGLSVLRVEGLGPGRKIPQPRAERFQLDYLLPEAEAQERVRQWRQFMAERTFPWYSVTKRGARTVDIRPMVESLSERGARELVLTFDWSGNRYVSPLKLVGAVNEGLSLKDYALTKLEQLFD